MATTTSAQQILRGMPVDAELPEACWELIARYRGELLNQAFAMLSNQEDAEDVVQETFADAFRQREKILQLQSIGAWLRAINRTNALTRARKRQMNGRKIERKQALLPERHATSGGFTAIELREAMARAMETLPTQQRAIVTMRYWENLPHEEIARRLKLPEGTVRRSFHEANLHLYERLRGLLEEGPAPVLEEGEK